MMTLKWENLFNAVLQVYSYWCTDISHAISREWHVDFSSDCLNFYFAFFIT